MTSWRRTRVGRSMAALLLGAIAGPALLYAHTALRRSDPARDAHLMEAPRRIALEFTEPIALATARVTLRGPSGDTLSLGPLHHADSTRRVVAADLIAAPRAGAHLVEWVVAGTDGHPVRGTFGFSVDSLASGLAPPAPDPAAAADTGFQPASSPGARSGATGAGLDASSPVYAGVRFLTFAAMLALIGAIALGLVVLPRASLIEPVPGAAMQAARRFAVVSAVALVSLEAGRLVLQTMAVQGSWSVAAARQILRGTPWGAGWLLQVVGALFVLVSLRRGPRPFHPAVAAGALAVVIGAPLSGHPVATPDAAAFAVVLDALHVLAAGLWLGTLGAILFAAIPAVRSASRDVMRALFVAFTPVALTGATLLLLSGLAGAWMQLGGLAALFPSSYGRLVLIKVALFAVIASIGLLNWRRFVPGLASGGGAGRLRTAAGLEIALAVGALLVTAVLTATTPPASGSP